MTVAVLFAYRDGSYSHVPGVDIWDETRDARLYMGPHPVVAHPPCARWCQMAHVVKARYGYEIGDDGGCFQSALESVRRWGGVLEHPAYSIAWRRFGIRRPPREGGWVRTDCGGWTCQLEQRSYGHPARKRTWLYYSGSTAPNDLRWGPGPDPVAVVTWCKNRTSTTLPRIGKKSARQTPGEFRDVLLDLARRSA